MKKALDAFRRSLFEQRGPLTRNRKLIASPLEVNTLAPTAPWNPNVGNVQLGPLRLDKVLGSGSYGIVYSGNIKSVDTTTGVYDDHPVAIKISLKTGVMLEESEIGETLTHAWLSSDPTCNQAMMCLYGLFVTKFHPRSPHWHYGIIMPLMDGDLFGLTKHIRSLPKRISDDKRFVWLMYITLAMVYDVYYMHSSGWAHNDVKPQNFLYRWVPTSPLPKIKISDFGFSCAALKNHRLKPHRDYTEELVKNYAIAAGVRPPAPANMPVAAEDCLHATTQFFQTPKWDGFTTTAQVFSKTPDIAENYENDAYCITMSVKTMFATIGFDMKNVLAQFNTGVYTEPGNAQWQQNQIAAWDIPVLDYSDALRAKLRDGNIPYEMLRNKSLRDIGGRFSQTLYRMGYEGMSVGEALGHIAEQVEDALQIEKIDTP